MFDNNMIGKLIKALREEKKLTQNVVSGLATLNEAHYSKIERGLRCPNIETIFKIAYALDMKPSELISILENQVKEKEDTLFL